MEQTVQEAGGIDEKVDHMFPGRTGSSRSAFPAEHSKALVSLTQPKDDLMMGLPSGASSPASTGSLAGSSLNRVLDATRKLQLHSMDDEASARSEFLTGSSLNRDLVLAKLNKEKVLSLIRAWEENNKTKSRNSYSKKVTKIAAWEVAKKARAEANLRTSEERLENEKAVCMERMKNQIAKVQRIAQEERALAEARHGEEIIKAEEIAAKCRASGDRPRRFPFCC